MAMESGTEMKSGAHDRRAVVADDWALLRAGLRSVLRHVGLTVAGELRDARDLVPIVGQLAPALTVLGSLAGVDVAGLVAKLKAAHDGAVLVLVTSAEASELAAVLAAGADGVELRSADDTAVVGAVRRVLAGERVVAPALLPALVGSVTPTPGRGDDALSPRERDVLACLANGSSNREIAEKLYISLPTVKTHLARIYSKLDVRNRHEAVARALALGLLG